MTNNWEPDSDLGQWRIINSVTLVRLESRAIVGDSRDYRVVVRFHDRDAVVAQERGDRSAIGIAYWAVFNALTHAVRPQRATEA